MQLQTLYIAGHEPATAVLGNGFRGLFEQPDELAAAAAPTRDGVEHAVLELLRYDGPNQFVRRIATTDLHFDGGHDPSGRRRLPVDRLGQPRPRRVRRRRRPDPRRPTRGRSTTSSSEPGSTPASAPTSPASRSRSPCAACSSASPRWSWRRRPPGPTERCCAASTISTSRTRSPAETRLRSPHSWGAADGWVDQLGSLSPSVRTVGDSGTSPGSGRVPRTLSPKLFVTPNQWCSLR